MVYRMIFNQEAYFGRGAIKQIPDVAKAHGFTKAFIVTDPVLIETGTVKKVTDVLDEAGMPYEVFSNVQPNPPVECIKDGVAKFADAGADFLIGLGGGSPQDTCKGIGIVAANPEFADVLSLEGVAATKNPSAPIFGVPTTAGTASETTINYVITDTANKRKFVAVDPHDIPIVAFVDPDLTDTQPRSLKVATGLDALTHAIEGYITPGAWSLSDCLSMQTIRMIAKNLAKSAEGDIPAGEQMAYASYITGMAYSNVGLGLVHGMAHPLGGRLGVAHGGANGILLAWNTTRTTPARSTVTSPTRSAFRTPTPAISTMCVTRRLRRCATSPRSSATRPPSPRSAPPRPTWRDWPMTRSTTCARRATRVRPPRRTSTRSTSR